MADLEQRNAWLHAQQRDRPLADVLAEWRQVGDRLLALVEAAPEEQLRSLVRVTPGADNLPADAAAEGDTWRLADLVAGQACGHPGRHYPAVRAWLEAGVRAPSAE
jgi:hypothetical protein